jgi:dihydropteroate synthase
MPRRAAHWKLRTRTLEFGRLPMLMGIVNVTPDSFSDGGRYLDPTAAVEHALRLAVDGADILDIGGESTRPGAEPVDAAEELRRVLPVIEALRRATPVPLSIDTQKSEVAREAIAAGAEIINDVSALTGDERMMAVAAESGCGVVAMHMKGTPRTMQIDPHYANVVAEVAAYLAARRDAMIAAGIAAESIALDPGIGFGKTVEHNLELLRGIGALHQLGCPLLVGHSRKRFIGQVLGAASADRTAGTLGVSIALALGGVQVVRVHDVAAVRQALCLFDLATDRSVWSPPNDDARRD